MRNCKADGPYGNIRTFCKKYKNRLERRKAKQNPSCQETYHKYRGWLS